MNVRPSSAEQIFSVAREKRDPHERAAYLEGACGGDLGLRSKVEALLEADAEAGSFLERARGRLGLPSSDTLAVVRTGPRASEERAGSLIGRYKLLQEIGEGGFGSVWMAEQREPVRRQVALKIIKLGMDTKEVIARFEAERQALALMDHPNICKVLDAGSTETGRPYFVMELVRGVPITDFCDTESLSARRRLELFIPVCNAIQHAHQKGIIHRDLKPSNVMVTLHDGKPVPKVIDFGIAKAMNRELTEKTLFTEYRQFIGTPEYMSPEQAELSGLDIDTRSDVYSLGVLLYELLTGLTPFDSKRLRTAGLDEIRRIIREEEPVRPSTRLSALHAHPGKAVTQHGSGAKRTPLQRIAKSRSTDASSLMRSLRGDLDWIVLKAMEKERGRRYETASGLALDIERHLHDEPVLASPPSTRYRFRKFVARNRAGVTVASLLLAALLLGIAGASWGLWRALEAERVATEERDEARVQAGIADAVNEFLNEDLLAAVAPSAEEGRGRDVRMIEVLNAAAERIDRESAPGGRFADKPRVEAAIRMTLGRTYAKLSHNKTAAPHIVRALELYRRVLGEEHFDTLESRLALALHRISYERDLSADVEADLRDVLATTKRVGDERRSLAVEALRRLGFLYGQQGRDDEAEACLLRGLELLRSWERPEDERRKLLESLANLYLGQGRLDEADRMFSEALRTLEDADVADAPSALRLALEKVYVLNERAERLEGAERVARFEESAGRLEKLRPRMEKVLGPHHWNTLNCLGSLAEVYRMLGRLEESTSLCEKVLEGRLARLPEDHDLVLGVRMQLARNYLQQGGLEEARRLYETVLSLSSAETRQGVELIVNTTGQLAEHLVGEGERAEAARVLERILEEKQGLIEHPRGAYLAQWLADVCRSLGRNEDAERWYLAALRSYGKDSERHRSEIAHLASHLGQLYVHLERHSDAVKQLEPAMPQLRAEADSHPKCLRDARAALVASYFAMDRDEDAQGIVDREIAEVKVEEARASDLKHVIYKLLVGHHPKVRRPAKALELAQLACARVEAEGGDDLWEFVHALAIAQVMTGRAREALETQKRAIRLVPEDAPPEVARSLREVLRRFEESAAREASTEVGAEEPSPEGASRPKEDAAPKSDRSGGTSAHGTASSTSADDER